ncbi:hypothetical protein Hanom_Chr12g01118161 [Helianthus anomalus]
MMFPEHHLEEFYWSEEDKLDRPLSPSIHRALDNPVVRVLKVDADVTPNGFGGKYEQNRYTFRRKDGSEQKITYRDLADQLHPMDLITLKKIYDQDKGNNRFVRRALDSISKAGVKLFEKVALSDFDMCINYDNIHQKKVHILPPDTSIPESWKRKQELE